MEISNEIKNRVVKLRRELHKIPEPGLKEYKTSAKIKEELNRLNLKYNDKIYKTGLLSYLPGKKGNNGNTVLLRADMDGLPISEENNLSFKSIHPGWMHACGHDAHMAIQLGVAMVFAENRDIMPGNLKLVFQPAEESVGGAEKMIANGAISEFSPVDYAISLHVSTGLKTGEIALAKKTSNASSTRWKITLKSKGGHGAYPHKGEDLSLVLGQLINMLHGIVSRKISASHPAVLSIGKIHGGTAVNILPEEIKVEGIIRTVRNEDKELIIEEIKNILTGLNSTYIIEKHLEINPGYPALVNNEKISELVYNQATSLLKEKNVKWMEKTRMGVEDFAYFLQEIPGAFWYLGCRNEDKQIIYPGHSSKFMIDEDALEIGLKLQVKLALKLMELEKDKNE